MVAIFGVLLLCGLLVNFQSLLTVLCCAIGVSTFLGEDLEEA